MRTTAKHPESTPIPVQLSEPEFTECIFPHFSRPKRGPRCKISSHCLFNLMLWVLYTGMPWKCLPVTACNPNGSDLQSAEIGDHIRCNNHPVSDRIPCN